jgi:predicted ATPase
MSSAGIAPEDGIRTTAGGYALKVHAGNCDLAMAEGLLAEGRAAADAHDAATASRRLTEMLALWQGTPLGEFTECAWAVATSTRIEEMRWAALEARIDAELSLGRHADLIGELEHACADSPLREGVWEQLMVALYRAGRQADALHAYRRARAVLADELGLQPSASLRALEQAIIEQDPALSLATTPALPTAAPEPRARSAEPADGDAREMLPRYRTSLVGRDTEVAEIAELIEPGTLVTLTGTGGTGKTRLAVEVARRLLADWPDGVAFVDLAATGVGQQVGPRMLRAVGAAGEPGRAWQNTLAGFLSQRSMLVVIDNCEHVLDAAQTAISLALDASPSSAVLATSREPLATAGERVWPVSSLPTTGIDPPAAQLLRQRAISADPGFAASQDELVALAERLGGLPLAVELVAPWTRALSLADIGRRLDEILEVAGRALPSRQQTLRATFEWSERLLDDAQRRVFHQLGVFLGGFDLAAAEAVITSDEQPATGLLSTLSRLVDASLVGAVPSESASRFRLLEPVRQFAIGQLADSDAAAVRDRHLAYYLALSAQAEPHLHLSDADEWCHRLDTEEGNFAAALTWALESDHDHAARLAASLWWYWWLRARTEEGIKSLKQIVAIPIGDPTAAVRSHIGLAGLLLQADQRHDGQAIADRAVTLAQASGDTRLLAHALGTVGRLALDTTDYERADHYLGQSLGHYRQLGSRGGQAWVLLMLAGGHEDQGRYDAAMECATEGRDLFDEKGDSWGVAWCESILSHVARATGRHDDALQLAESCVARFEMLSVKDEGIVRAYVNLGAAQAGVGDLKRALAALDRSERYAAGLADRLPYEQMFDAIATIAEQANLPAIHARCQNARRELRSHLGRGEGSLKDSPNDAPAGVGRRSNTSGGTDTARTLLDELIQQVGL